MNDTNVAVIGGGAIGLSVARELRRAGVERVTVLEREDSFGRGSSTKANGGVRAQFTTPINIAFSLYSIEELERLSERYAIELSFRQNGYLMFTADPERAAALNRATELQRSLGVETKLLSPERVAAIAPIVHSEGLAAATFHARDGYLDPHGLLTVFEHECRYLGVELTTNAEVTGLERHDRGFVVTSGRGVLRADWVVNAAGTHARAIASHLGLDVPVYPVRRNLAYVHDPESAVTTSSPPMCVDLDTGVLVRPEGSEGFVIAYSDPTDQPGWDTTLDPGFLPAVAARIGSRFPALEGKTIHPKHCWAGLYPETPDGHAIVGETGVPGFVQCAGFGGHGLMHSFAGGRAVAELITMGRCVTFELHLLRPERFEDGDLAIETAVL